LFVSIVESSSLEQVIL